MSPLLSRIKTRGRAAAGPDPWSRGYVEHRERSIVAALGDDSVLGAFRDGRALPAGYGIGIDERCVELPWLVSQLPARAGATLDAGSTLNHGFVLDAVLPLVERLHVLTLAPEPDCFWQRGVSYLFHDLRDVPIRSAFYDVVACLSTLEHVGFDNSSFTGEAAHAERRPGDFVLAARELRRLTRPGGTILLTVPFGVHRELSSFQQFDLALLERAIEALGPTAEVERRFYRYDGGGWQAATAEESAGSEYVPWVAERWAGRPWPQPLPVEEDRAAAARAVACLRAVTA